MVGTRKTANGSTRRKTGNGSTRRKTGNGSTRRKTGNGSTRKTATFVHAQFKQNLKPHPYLNDVSAA